MRWSMLQNSLFPYQKNIEATARSLGMSAGMLPGWARKAAMSSFQPVPAPKKKKKKKSGAKAGRKAGTVKTVPEEAQTAAAAGTPEIGQAPAEKVSGAQERPAETPGTGQEPAEKESGAEQASAEMLPGTAPEQCADLPDLRTMMLWSEILGEPAARKRRRRGK